MKRFLLIAFSLTLCSVGWMQIRDYHWAPDGAPRWNPLALRESGFGRTLSRFLTEQANTSYHHGLSEGKPPLSTNPVSHWLDAGNLALGFQGRLRYRPIEQYPLQPFEVKQALEQVEKNLRLAFELDPGNYTAYDVYLYFLTTEVTQTEFASLQGAQLKDEDDDEPTDADAAAQEPRQGGNDAPEAPTGRTPVQPIGDQNRHQPALQSAVFKGWAAQERERRHALAIEITDEAIRKFRPSTMDPERFLTAAVMWYNRFMLLAPDPEERQRSAAARKAFEVLGPPTLSKMNDYLEKATACQMGLEKNGSWQALPERRKEFLQLQRLMEKCASALSVALQANRTQMAEEQPGSSIWGPLGKN